FLDEDDAALAEGLHDVPVVHDLLADVHRRPVLLQGFLHGDDRTVDARAVAARLGQQDPLARTHAPYPTGTGRRKASAGERGHPELPARTGRHAARTASIARGR